MTEASNNHSCEAYVSFAWFSQMCGAPATKRVLTPDPDLGDNGWVWTCADHDFTKVQEVTA